MAERSNIEWCDATFNPWIGCTKVSPACDHCYAERGFDHRRHVVQWGAGQARKRTGTENWKHPGLWNKQVFAECPECGWRGELRNAMRGCDCPSCMQPGVLVSASRRVFCASLADVFDNEVPPEWRAELFALIANTPNLNWLLLTKRPQNIVRMVRSHGSIAGNGTRYLPDNVWLGTTIEDQKRAEINLPALLRTREEIGARVLFVSVEPMLGPIDLTDIVVRHGGGTEDHFSALYDADDDEADTASYIDWVICGGESGPHARPMHPDWARSLRDQCAAAGVPFMFKQWGEWTPGENVARRTGVVQSATRFDGKWLIGTEDLSVEDGHIDDEPNLYRIGKKAAGRLLDGVEHNGFPEVRP